MPKRNQRRLDPVPDGAEPVNPGVAGGAEGNQKARVMNARPAMVNRQLPLRPTGAATAAVALENGVAMSGEAEAGVGLSRIARSAQSGTQEACLPAGAEKPGLPIPPQRIAGR